MGARDGKRKARRLTRDFFKAETQLVGHPDVATDLGEMRWLNGARLQVYLVARSQTTFGPVWSGWTTEQIARMAGGITVRTARRALADLAKTNPVTRRKYIRIRFGMGRSPNVLEVLHPTSDVTTSKQQDLDWHGGHGCPRPISDASSSSNNEIDALGGHECPHPGRMADTGVHHSDPPERGMADMGVPIGGHGCPPFDAEPMTGQSLTRPLDLLDLNTSRRESKQEATACARDPNRSEASTVPEPEGETALTPPSRGPDPEGAGRAAWEAACHALQAELSEHSYRTWIRPLRPVQLAAGVLTVVVPNGWFEDWLTKHYRAKILAALEPGTDLRLQVDPTPAATLSRGQR